MHGKWVQVPESTVLCSTSQLDDTLSVWFTAIDKQFIPGHLKYSLSTEDFGFFIFSLWYTVRARPIIMSVFCFLFFLSRLMRSNEQVVRGLFVVLKTHKLHPIAQKLEAKSRQSHISRITGVFLFKNHCREKVLFNRCAILHYLLKVLKTALKKMNKMSWRKHLTNSGNDAALSS